MARLPVLSLPSGGPSQDPFEQNSRTLPSRVKPEETHVASGGQAPGTAECLGFARCCAPTSA